MRAPTAGLDGTVIAAFGRRCIVRLASGDALACLQTGRAEQPVCGDRVSVQRTGESTGQVVAIAARSNLYSRRTGARTKRIAANISQLLAVTACEPAIDDELLCRFLIAAEDAGIRVMIALNKIDLRSRLNACRKLLEPFRMLGYPIVELSASEDISPVLAALRGHRTLLVGQSGMGKSTIINRLVPDANARVAEISRHLGTGRQTTTSSRLYAVEPDIEVIDTPGVSQFGLAAMDLTQILRGFPEFLPHAIHCRFPDCQHLSEPDCAVQASVESGLVHPRRLQLYRQIRQIDIRSRR